jgi:XTP/dITP diphosphohydrolase
LILATRNEHKLRELAEILPLELRPLPDDVELPPESGDTFEANALIKARAAVAATGETAIADDSGIAARGLAGGPGVHSARYAGPDASDEENLDKLLREVAASGADRRAAYVCVIALVGRDGTEATFEGRCEGTLIEQPRGSGGFGYDPIFVPDDTGPPDGRTMAELSPEEKNAISHRGRAAGLLARHLEADP